MKKIIASVVIFAVAFAALWIYGSTGTPPSASSTDNNNTETVQQTESKEETTTTTDSSKKEYAAGETWTVDGQWSLTVDSIEETQERNEYDDRNPGAVYIVSYTYENLGYTDPVIPEGGLFFGMSDGIVDSNGVMGYDYPVSVSQTPKETPIGATCHAQSCIAVENPGTVTLNVQSIDSTETLQRATFVVTP